MFVQQAAWPHTRGVAQHDRHLCQVGCKRAAPAVARGARRDGAGNNAVSEAHDRVVCGDKASHVRQEHRGRNLVDAMWVTETGIAELHTART